MKRACRQGGGVRSHAYLNNVLGAVVVWKITAKGRGREAQNEYTGLWI